MNSFGNERAHMRRQGGAFVASTASVMGRVELAARSNVWYGAVLRGDDDLIRLGEESNLQDNVVVHPIVGIPTLIAEQVTVGHGAILHMTSIGARTLIGMGSILLAGAEIGEECLIAAGTLVKEGQIIPPRSLVVGSPGRIVRSLSDEEVAFNVAAAAEYVVKARMHLLDGE